MRWGGGGMKIPIKNRLSAFVPNDDGRGIRDILSHMRPSFLHFEALPSKKNKIALNQNKLLLFYTTKQNGKYF